MTTRRTATSCILHAFEQRLSESWPPGEWAGVTVLVAVSGGPDSVALLRGLHHLRQSGGSDGRLVVAHVNHRLRPEADAEEAFVRELAERLGLPCEAARVDPAELDLGDGLESAARCPVSPPARCRRAARHRYLATGHTDDDQAETMLHHILRGAGLAGLAGMPRARLLGPAVTLIRPLLGLRRSDVEEYLVQLGQASCHDATNLSLEHTRNRVRHELLPLLTERFGPQVTASLLRLGALAGEAHQVLAGLGGNLADEAAAALRGGEVQVSRERLAGQPRYVVREMFCQLWRRQGWPLQDMTFRHWEELADMTVPGGGAAPIQHVFPGNVTVRADGHALRLVRAGARPDGSDLNSRLSLCERSVLSRERKATFNPPLTAAPNSHRCS